MFNKDVSVAAFGITIAAFGMMYFFTAMDNLGWWSTNKWYHISYLVLGFILAIIGIVILYKAPKKDNSTVEKFKEKIIEMYRGYPNYLYINEIEKVVPDPRARNILVNNQILIKASLQNGQEAYLLGVNGVNLANSFINEDLTKSIKKLTTFLLLFTILMVIATII